MTLSDRVVIMHRGKIMQIGSPQAIYARPVNRFVADFIGKANFLEGRVGSMSSSDEIAIDILSKKFQVVVQKGSFSEGQRVLLVVRPESVKLRPKMPDTLSGTVQEAVYLGSQMVYEVELANNIITVEIANPQEHMNFKAGEEVTISFQEKSLHILPYEEAR
jgi:iron(III) transport system ATP-binding protein